MPPVPDRITVWQPRADEHDLARSLNMVDCTAVELAERVAFLRQQAPQVYPGVPVKVGRWHIWRMVRELALLGLTNTPDGRAAASGSLASLADERAKEQRDDLAEE